MLVSLKVLFHSKPKKTLVCFLTVNSHFCKEISVCAMLSIKTAASLKILEKIQEVKASFLEANLYVIALYSFAHSLRLTSYSD